MLCTALACHPCYPTATPGFATAGTAKSKTTEFKTETDRGFLRSYSDSIMRCPSTTTVVYTNPAYYGMTCWMRWCGSQHHPAAAPPIQDTLLPNIYSCHQRYPGLSRHCTL